VKKGGKIVVVTWCRKNDGLSRDDQAHLNTIYKEWALPFFISIEEYRQLAQGMGFTSIHTADWTKQAKPTWPHAVWDGLRHPWFVFRAGPLVLFRTLRDCYAIYKMNAGYNNGLIRFGLICATKTSKI